jgi:hypothetical protein
MFRDFTVSDDSAFQWWAALSKVMGCNPASSSSCATTVNSNSYNDGLILYLTKRFYTIGQYKQVRAPRLHTPPRDRRTERRADHGDGTSAQTVSVRLPSNGVVTSAAYRTSAGENLAAIGPPTVSTGTASLQLPAQTITTYVCHAG